MARARIIKPGFFSNDKLAEIPAHGRLLFAGLWTIADREGRLPDRVMWIKGSIFPYEDVAVDCFLEQLAAGGFIQRYEIDGDRFIQITGWAKHQRPHIKEVASTIPAPIRLVLDASRKWPAQYQHQSRLVLGTNLDWCPAQPFSVPDRQIRYLIRIR